MLIDQVRRFICGLHGHEALLHFEQGRMSLQCTSCGYQTPGWDIRREPLRTTTIEAQRQMAHLPLVSERRVA